VNTRSSSVAGVAALVIAFACGAPALTQSSPGTPSLACASLATREVSPSVIALPTKGAIVDTAVLIPASDLRIQETQAVLAIPEYCKVNGHVVPVDPAAPPINFQVNLPTNWNRKAAQMGGSGLNGSIPVSLTTGMQWGPESIPPDTPYALSRGFAVFGSDSGHQGGGGRGAPANPQPADWTLNAEALTNFAYGQMKKTRDVAIALIRQRYDAAPRKIYYFGTSQGGREALIMAQRFPQDYDGVLSQVPVFPQLYWLILDPLFRIQQQAGDGWIPPSKVPVIGREVLRQCDGLDGLADGFVSNYIACNAKFDPQTVSTAWSAVRCADGVDAGDSCLSEAQIASLQKFYGRVTLPFPLHKNWTSYPGWTTGGELPTNWKAFASRPDANTAMPWLKTVIANDASATPIGFALDKYRQRIQELSTLLDAQDPDLSAFRAHGGKLILKVNTTDYTANPRWSYDYYEKVVSTMGQQTVDSFMRFYVAVGIFHNRNVGRNPLTNETVPNYVDFIAMLDDWVDGGKVPADTQILRDMPTVPPFTVRSSLPMCRYPQYPRYNGQGDPKQASSYTCTKP
jgi:pimeloyl-ACP methyl ester carboxylesterase